MTIKEYAKAQGLTLRDMAERLEVHPSRLSQLEGTAWPAELALKVEEVTGGAVSASDLSPVVAKARQ